MNSDKKKHKSQYPIIIINEKAAEKLKNGSPFVFRDDIVRFPPDIQPGIAGMTTPGGRWIGIALVQPSSSIFCRFLTHKRRINLETLIIHRLKRAVDFRTAGLGFGNGSCRLVNGEADGIPGVVVDRIGNGITVQSFSESADIFIPVITKWLENELKVDVIVLKNTSKSRSMETQDNETRIVYGENPLVDHYEGNIRFEIDLVSSQKTGTFLDQVSNHMYMGEKARGRCLDLFSYNGGFALAMAENQCDVTAVDSSQSAVEKIKRNAELNNLNVKTQVGDVFFLLRKYYKNHLRFDTIVCDPPALAKSRKDIPGALRGYQDLALNCFKLLDDEGLLFFCSCSSHVNTEMLLDVIKKGATDAGKKVVLLETRRTPVDHPSIISIPETDYLKCFLLRVIM
ncbi:MAG: class I SAM-dependent rRNA methyltransferase [Deltaproteobacteria bacterium]|nr:class I SAM-dependent rRNA methyltransferase [Deltaproteobacteria bacterium]